MLENNRPTVDIIIPLFNEAEGLGRVHARICSVVDGLEIGVNGETLFVPRSVFSDRADLNGAEIRPDKDGVVLVLSGGDASESYELRITFDAEHVTGRTLISGEFGDVLQKTTYFQSRH